MLFHSNLIEGDILHQVFVMHMLLSDDSEVSVKFPTDEPFVVKMLRRLRRSVVHSTPLRENSCVK